MTLFSIVTINYNNLSGLKKTINSVLSQSYNNFELIIIDGASNDGSNEFCHKLTDERVRVISEVDEGIYDALNKGIRNSTGEIIQLLHSGDCFTHIHVLKEIVSAFERNNCNAIYGNKRYVSYIYDDIRVDRYWRPGSFHKSKYLYGWMIPHLALSVRKSLYDKFGLYRTDIVIAADYEWMLRVFYFGNERAQYLDLDIVNMETGGISNNSVQAILKSNLQVLKSWHINRKFAIPFWIFMLKPLSKISQRIMFKRKIKNGF